MWLGLAADDAGGGPLARDALAAVTGGDPGTDEPPPEVVAEAIWARSPVHVCLVLDDVHHVPAGSPGARWLGGLVDALPANGHLLLAARVAPPVPLARLTAQGAVLRLDEDDLRFTAEELAGFAARRHVEVARLEGTGGWPAMAELAAAVDGDLAGDFLWEEVLEPLGPERRRTLAVLVALGGADDDLASAALGRPVDLDRELDGVPLVARGAAGWRAPHPLWGTVRGLDLPADERRAVARRAVTRLVDVHRYDDALALVESVGVGDVLPDVLRAAAIGPDRPPTAWLRRCLDALPAGARGTVGAALAAGVEAAARAPAESVDRLREAVARCRAAGDVEAELSALAVLGRVAWWRGDVALVGELFPRVLELEAAGHPLARAVAGLGRAIGADLAGDDAGTLAHLDAIPPGVLDPAWQAVTRWLRATVLLGTGRGEEAAAALEALPASPDPAFELTVEGTRLALRWSRGEVDEVVAALPGLLDRAAAAGVVQNMVVGTAQAALVTASLGDVATAERHLAAAERSAAASAVDHTARLALAAAATRLAAGDEPAAAGVLGDVLARRGHDVGSGTDRRVWRTGLALTYVLVPPVRAGWDRAELVGHLEVARRLARAVVALRSGCGVRDLAVPDPALVRALLPLPFAVELALGLGAAGRREGAALLEALGPRGRAAVRAVAEGGGGRERAARSLLAAVPAPPPHVVDIGVLGPLTLARDGEPVVDGDLRRERVRALLAFLVVHRRTTRRAITAALWPDHDDTAAANNLRVTMTYLKRLLEPWRAAKEPAYAVRTEGQQVVLVTGDRVRVDADLFDDHLGRAARAEADGTPSVALEHHLAACELYRGPAYDGVPDAPWLDAERDRLATRFVAAATRAAELLAGRGDLDEAERLARRAVDADPWAEDAHAVLVATALDRGDRRSARRHLERALAALAELGVEPSEPLLRGRRRLRGAGP